MTSEDLWFFQEWSSLVFNIIQNTQDFMFEDDCLVVYLPWKMMEFGPVRKNDVRTPTEWKVIKVMFQTTKQTNTWCFGMNAWDSHGASARNPAQMAPTARIARSKRLTFTIELHKVQVGRKTVCWSLSCATTSEPGTKSCHVGVVRCVMHEVKRKIRCPQLGH